MNLYDAIDELARLAQLPAEAWSPAVAWPPEGFKRQVERVVAALAEQREQDDTDFFSRFVQVTAAGDFDHEIIALDGRGQVWRYDSMQHCWTALGTKRHR